MFILAGIYQLKLGPLIQILFRLLQHQFLTEFKNPVFSSVEDKIITKQFCLFECTLVKYIQEKKNKFI